MSNHTVSSFDEELRHLHQMAVKMGDLACHQLDGVLDAIEGANSGVAARIVEREPEADRMEREIEAKASLLAYWLYGSRWRAICARCWWH
jgi:phosphate transport system protein